MPKPRVLLVDDDEDVRNMTRVALTFEGFDLVEAADGDAGVAAVRAHRPDAVVLDVMMPGRDGFDVLRELRAEQAHAALPVVVLTAKAGPKPERESRAAGATAYLTKPFTPSALAGTLRGLLAGGDPCGAPVSRLDVVRRIDAVAERGAR